jgi:hypothetical protein
MKYKEKMTELKLVGGSVFVNGDTGENIITPYSQAEIDELKRLLNLSDDEVAKIAMIGLSEEEIVKL